MFSTSESHKNGNPNEQLEWLETILNKSVRNKETVSIIYIYFIKNMIH